MTKYEFITVIISSFALFSSVLSALFVYFQVRGNKRQLFLDNASRISDINRSLIILGFSDPELFDIIEGREIESKTKQRRYIQLWVNQADFIHSAYRLGVLDKQTWKALESDLGQLFALENVRKHWERVQPYYGEDMVQFVSQLNKQYPVIYTKPSRTKQSITFNSRLMRVLKLWK